MLVTKEMLHEFTPSDPLGRLCLHNQLDDPLHVMLLVLAPSASYPPHYHKARAEFYWVIEGTMALAVAEESGDFTEVALDPREQPGFLVSPGVVHAVRNSSSTEVCRFLEVRPGPFDPNDNVALKR